MFSQSIFSQGVFSQGVFSQSVFFQSVFFQTVFLQSVFLRNIPNLRVFASLLKFSLTDTKNKLNTPAIVILPYGHFNFEVSVWSGTTDIHRHH